MIGVSRLSRFVAQHFARHSATNDRAGVAFVACPFRDATTRQRGESGPTTNRQARTWKEIHDQ